MSILAIRNIGTLVSGDLEIGILDADTILCSWRPNLAHR